MKLRLQPLLQIERDIYRVPHGTKRFRTYLGTMIDRDIDDLRFPLTMMNPMAKDHAAGHLDQLLALDAEDVAARAIADAEQDLESLPGEYQVALVLVDDLRGGWTNRFAAEFSHRFECREWYDRNWIIGLLWTSESPSTGGVREAVLTAIYRLAYVLTQDTARTLRDRMAQEGYAMVSASCPGPVLDDDDMAYSREVIAAYLDTEDMRTTIQCLFGDPAGKTLGFPPFGLSSLAGLAVARADARERLHSGAQGSPALEN
jgi:hypothetical protein